MQIRSRGSVIIALAASLDKYRQRMISRIAAHCCNADVLRLAFLGMRVNAMRMFNTHRRATSRCWQELSGN